MSGPISSSSSQSTTRAGMCPHGLPPAACPICSGGGMSGGGKKHDAVKMAKPMTNEWSWMKCYTVGLAMKAAAARTEENKTAFERQIEFAAQMHKQIQNMSEKIRTAIENIQKLLPQPAANIVQNIAKFVINPILNLISQIPKVIEKFAQFQKNIANMLQQAGEKLTAFLFDLKKFVDKTIVENVKKVAKKIFLFFISYEEDENYNNDETLSIFKSREIKKYLVKLIKPIKKRNDNETGSSKAK